MAFPLPIPGLWCSTLHTVAICLLYIVESIQHHHNVLLLSLGWVVTWRVQDEKTESCRPKACHTLSILCWFLCDSIRFFILLNEWATSVFFIIPKLWSHVNKLIFFFLYWFDIFEKYYISIKHWENQLKVFEKCIIFQFFIDMNKIMNDWTEGAWVLLEDVTWDRNISVPQYAACYSLQGMCRIREPHRGLYQPMSEPQTSHPATEAGMVGREQNSPCRLYWEIWGKTKASTTPKIINGWPCLHRK